MPVESKLINFDVESREEMLQGVNMLADAVSVTMGPLGMNVVIESPGSHPIVTKDGVTVAKSIAIKDKFKNLGIDIVKESASRTADTAGDGTTTATVIANAIFTEGVKMLAAGHSSRGLISGIKKCAQMVSEEVSKSSRKVEGENEILQVATISANGEDSIGEIITEAMNKLGTDGVITVEMAKGFNSELIVVEGMQINRGYISPYFVNNSEKMVSELDSPRILLCNQKITSVHDISHILEESLQSGTPVLIVADDIEGDALQAMVVNTARGNLKSCGIKAPGFGNARVGMMEDLSLMLGTEILNGDSETLKSLSLTDLGTCSKVIVSRSSTTFVDCPAEKDVVDERVESLRDALESPTLSNDERMVIRVRLARLAGGVGIIKVGGATEGELIERKDRVDDALNATQAAVEEGIVPGGGSCLLSASAKVKISKFENDERAGAQVLLSSCKYPIRKIVENAGGSADLVISKLLDEEEDNIGYDVVSEEFCNMFERGIIDPSKVTRSALENAVSAACTLLSAGCSVIVDDLEDN